MRSEFELHHDAPTRRGRIRRGVGNLIFGSRRPRNRRRRKRRRLTGLGRLLVVSALLLVPLMAWGGRAAWQSLRSADERSPLPAVSALPQPARVDPRWLERPPRSRERFESARAEAQTVDPSSASRLVEQLDPVGGPFRIEYTLDEALTERIFEILRKGRVQHGHAIVIDPRSGRLLAYVSTDPEGLPAGKAYPSASIVKILTAAAMLEEAPEQADSSCVYRGNKYRINRRRLERPEHGRESTLEDALATSNNQCFSQWAVHELGEEKLRRVFGRFGWLEPPAPGHEAGRMEAVETPLDLGRLGSGLDGVRVTPLHVAALASVLSTGRSIEPWWVDRVVDAYGRSLELPARAVPRPVLDPRIAAQLREMLVSTTTRGTAKRAFRTRRGRPLMPGIDVAGKTGNLSGRDPTGRYEWFMGVAPADAPTIGVVVLQLQEHLWWKRSSELAASILEAVFCERRRCDAQLANRYTGDLPGFHAPLLMSEIDQPPVVSRLD